MRFLLLLFLTCSAFGSPLETAEALAKKDFAGWTYGAKAADRQIDCVQFMAAVIAQEVARPLGKAERNTININHGWTAEEVQAKAETGKDPKVSGLVHALVDLMKVAERVPLAEARPGDFVQYWMKRKDGRWFGHASLIAKVEGGHAVLYGSHKSTNGIAMSGFKLNLLGKDRHVYLARLKP